jgi:cell division protein FtsZ
MGGGTGTGSAPVVAKAAREMGILTVGVVTRPYAFENRDKAAEAGIEELAQHVDSLIVIPNEKLKKLAGKNFSIRRAFDMANEVLHNAVQGVAETITREGFINVDFEDVRTVMSSRGLAMMGVGSAAGEDRAAKATLAAISNPLLEDINIQGARGILVNVTGNDELGLDEYEEVGRLVNQFAHPDATVKIGLTFDDSMSDEVRVTIIATGLSSVGQAAVQPKAEVKQPEPVAPVQPEPTNGGTRRHWTPLTPSTPATASATKVPGMVASTNIAGLRQGSTGVIGASTNESHAYLNIPSFIRRQAD